MTQPNDDHRQPDGERDDEQQDDQRQDDERRASNARWWNLGLDLSLKATVTLTVTLAVTIAISVTLAIVAEGAFWETTESGWALTERTQTIETTSSAQVNVSADLDVAGALSSGTLTVDGDIQVTGSELQMIGSDCSERSSADWSYVCFDGEQLLLSTNGGEYLPLGIAGAATEPGEQGEPGPPGPPGPSARLWIPDSEAVRAEPSRVVNALGSGFVPDTVISILVTNPDGVVTELGEVPVGANGTFFVFAVYPDFETGMYLLSARDEAGEELATHPICDRCGIEGGTFVR